ncbi:TetR/AcrR family transcriptional regulator [Neorhizobium lilium]|uniref:TetR/AcrR family transcriptional regulator n=1 Tax=Neorhizobium lilium TaxID=2503024 RepID=UPI0013E2E1E8|nr:TetR/AcrR family transcriptional regulator [Neorhizobium lilium]
MRRPRRKAEETRDDILAAAEILLRKKGLTAFSIANLAAELKMSPANVFKHFHSKTALADAICERHVVQMIGRFQAFDEPIAAPERLVIAVRRLMETHLADIKENPYLFEMLVVVSEADLPSGRHYKQLIENLFANLVRHGIETGVYKCTEDSAITRNVGSAFASVLHPVFLMRADEAELRERCDGLAALVNAALQNPLAK